VNLRSVRDLRAFRGVAMLLKIGSAFELELRAWSLYLRVGRRAVFIAPGSSAVDWR
jgi:hypothetical protein